MSIVTKIEGAAERNDAEAVAELVVRLGVEVALLRNGQEMEEIFAGMLRALDHAKTPGNVCGWDVFVWFELNIDRLTEPDKEILKEYVADAYGSFTDSVLCSEVAHWVGAHQCEWATQVIKAWLSIDEDSIPFSSIGRAIDEFLNGGKFKSLPEELQRMMLALKSRYEKKRTG